MPLYEYKCDRCGTVFEVMQKFADVPLETHENCGGHVDRLLSAPALQFKGTGWYVTDYARKSSNGKSPAKSEGKDKDSTAKPAKTEPSTSSSSTSASSTTSSEKK